jgi:crossover junction endodeoxyribonuclease RusA
MPKPTLKATLPYPPTVNHYWVVGNRRVYISPEGRQYRRRVKAILAGVPTLDGDVAMAVMVHPPDRRARDLDNVLKALLDALEQAGVYRDDNQVANLHLVRFAPAPPGRVEVWVSPLADTEANP